VVAGAGGYPHLTSLGDVNGGRRPGRRRSTDVTLQTYVTDRHGYLLVEITSGSIELTYKTVPTPTEPADDSDQTAETLSVPLRRS